VVPKTCTSKENSWLGLASYAWSGYVLRDLSFDYHLLGLDRTRLRSRVVSVLDSDAVGPGLKSQPRRCRVTVLGKLFTPIVPLFTKQQNW